MKTVQFNGAASGSPDTSAWHNWRAQGIGSSEASIIAYDAGLITEKASWMISKNRLWGIKRGVMPPVDADNPATRRGRTHEERALARIESETGIVLAPSFGEMDTFPAVRSSFDGMSFDEGIIAEVKCPSSSIHLATKDEGVIPPYYLTQLAHQGLTAWDHPDTWQQDQVVLYGSFVPENNDLHIIEMTAHKLRDLLDVPALYQSEIAFWQWVQATETEEHSPEWIAAAIEWADLHEKSVVLKKRLDELRDVIIKPLSDTHPIMRGFGVEASRSSGASSMDLEVDYKAMFEQVIKQAKIRLNQAAWEAKFTKNKERKGRTTVRLIR
jgi:putative phage-type endonuclease